MLIENIRVIIIAGLIKFERLKVKYKKFQRK